MHIGGCKGIKRAKIDHGDIYIVFTVAEELGLLGAKNLDLSDINAKYGFVLDLGEVDMRQYLPPPRIHLI